MADFTVTRADGRTRKFTGASDYTLKDSGLLTVTDDDGTQIVYSPGGWLTVIGEQAERRSAYEDNDLTVI